MFAGKESWQAMAGPWRAVDLGLKSLGHGAAGTRYGAEAVSLVWAVLGHWDWQLVGGQWGAASLGCVVNRDTRWEKEGAICREDCAGWGVTKTGAYGETYPLGGWGMRRPRDSKDGIRVRRGRCQTGKVVLPAMRVIQCRSKKSRGRPQEQRAGSPFGSLWSPVYELSVARGRR